MLARQMRKLLRAAAWKLGRMKNVQESQDCRYALLGSRRGFYRRETEWYCSRHWIGRTVRELRNGREAAGSCDKSEICLDPRSFLIGTTSRRHGPCASPYRAAGAGGPCSVAHLVAGDPVPRGIKVVPTCTHVPTYLGYSRSCDDIHGCLLGPKLSATALIALGRPGLTILGLSFLPCLNNPMWSLHPRTL